MTERLRGLDHIFLHVDSPNRPMNICNVFLYDEPIDKTKMLEEIHRHVETFPRVKQRPVEGGLFSTAKWADCPDFKLEDQCTEHTLKEGTEAELQNFTAEFYAKPWDRNKPLWRVAFVNGLKSGGAMVLVGHHCYADGQGFVRAFFYHTDARKLLEEKWEEHKKSMRLKKQKPLQAKDLPLLRNPALLPYTEQLPKPALSAWASLVGLLQLVATFVVGFLLMFKLWVEGMVFTRKSLNYKGEQTTEKLMSWTAPMSMEDIKTVRKAYDLTLNDVMCTVVTRAVKTYLEDIKGRHDDYVSMMIPFSLRYPDDYRVYNVSTGSVGYFPLYDMPTESLAKAVHQEMMNYKRGFVPQFFYFYMTYAGLIPLFLPLWFINWILGKIHCVLTNVPGPHQEIEYGGQRVRGLRPFPPQNSKGSLGLAIFSYAGNITVQCITDKTEAYPDQAHRVCEIINQEFDRVVLDAKAKLKERAIEEYMPEKKQN
ncbi:uncharacterized protein VTP21DRAFT_6026 [Calcarisporiella thermophila]|uniref:uncharacterized protein n=1 Tax=Calcarisporiella thermophila TaxID=911321 RepID=UPI003742EDAD